MEEFSCAMVDSCPPYFSETELTEMFMQNFRRHYDTNRAPLGLYFHTLWFKEAKNRRAFRKFLDDMVGGVNSRCSLDSCPEFQLLNVKISEWLVQLSIFYYREN